MKYNWLTKTVGELTSYIAKGIPPKYIVLSPKNIKINWK